MNNTHRHKNSSHIERPDFPPPGAVADTPLQTADSELRSIYHRCNVSYIGTLDPLSAALIHQRDEARDLRTRLDEIATIPVDHGRYITSTYVTGEQQSIQQRYDFLEKELSSLTQRKAKVMDDTEQPVVTFTNEAPEDKEWTAHIKLLNEYCTPERYLREIVQYARSGPFYPADMHVSLIKQATQCTHPVPTPVDGKLREAIICELITSMPGFSPRYRAYAEEIADELVALFAAHLQAAVTETLTTLNKESKLLQDPYKGKNNAMSVAYRRGAQDADSVWHGQIDEQLKKGTEQ